MATTRSFIHVPINVLHLFKFTKNCSSYIIADSENCWFWFFEKKESESKNRQPWLLQTPLKNQHFHERTSTELALLWPII
jgi:hypothetical protein